jgi:GT2 family glycosyltransferase
VTAITSADVAQLPKISAIIPIYGRMGDLPRLLEHLRRQTLPPHEIIVVDSSPRPLEGPPAGVQLVPNPEDIGLACDLNLGAVTATGDYLLIIQQDCLPETDHAIEELFAALTPGRVAVASTVNLPHDVWSQYNYWGKVLMARWRGDVKQGISDKFDLIRRDVFNRIGGYDVAHFAAGGQDMDLCLRLMQHGEVCISPTRVLHLHYQSKPTRWTEIFTKQFQIAESFGALFRKWRFGLRRAPYAGHWIHHLSKYLYPLLLVLPFAPRTVGLALFVLTNVAHWETLTISVARAPLMLIFNPIIFLFQAAGTLRGLFSGRQQYSQDKVKRV